MTIRWTLGALVIALATTAWLSTTQAWNGDDEGDRCRSECQAQHEICIDSCGEHSDPVDCDSACREASEDCQDRCN